MDSAAFTKRNSLVSGRFQTKAASEKSASSPRKTVFAYVFTKRDFAPSSIRTPQTANVRRTKRPQCDALAPRRNDAEVKATVIQAARESGLLKNGTN